MNDIYTWQNDLYPLVKKRFDMRYAKRLDAISEVCDVVCQDDIDYRIEGIGGYGEMMRDIPGMLLDWEQPGRFISANTV